MLTGTPSRLHQAPLLTFCTPMVSCLTCRQIPLFFRRIICNALEFMITLLQHNAAEFLNPKVLGFLNIFALSV